MNPLPALGSFPFLESSILISLACSGVHPYFSSPIHNSKQDLGNKKKKRSTTQLLFYHTMTVACCAFGLWGGAAEEQRGHHLHSRQRAEGILRGEDAVE